jgi:hypothetical protein
MTQDTEKTEVKETPSQPDEGGDHIVLNWIIMIAVISAVLFAAAHLPAAR